MKLYEIIENIESALEAAAANEGEVSDDLFERFDRHFKDLAGKVDHWIGFRDAIKATITMKKEQAKRLADKAKANENLLKRLDGYLQFMCGSHGKIKLEGSLGTICVQKSAPSVRLGFEADKASYSSIVPQEIIDKHPELLMYCKELKGYNLDKKALLRDMKEGEELEPAVAVLEQGTHIRIRG